MSDASGPRTAALAIGVTVLALIVVLAVLGLMALLVG